MPIEYTIINRKKLVFAKGSGIITGSEVLTHLDKLSKDKQYIAPMKKLVDYRFIESIDITQEEAWEIAEKKSMLSTIFHGELCAFVSPGDLTYGTSRVHQALIDGADIDTQVFRRFEDALKWLDVTLEKEI